MKSIENRYKESIINELSLNTLLIVFPDGEYQSITEDNIVSESMTLKQSVCDEEKLKFGGCISSEFKIQLVNTENRSFGNDLVGKYINVKLTQTFPGSLYPAKTLYPSSSLYPEGDSVNYTWDLFSGYIDSAELDQSDNNVRSIIAYDSLAKLNETDGTDKLYGLWKNSDNGCSLEVLLKNCLNSNAKVNISYDFGERLNETLGAINRIVKNYLTMNRAWLENYSKITYGEIIRNVCEMLGVFGFIRANSNHGEFNFIYRKSTDGSETYNSYERFYAKEFETKGYTGAQLMIGVDSEKTSKTMTVQSGYRNNFDYENYYDLTDNIICWQEREGTSAFHPFEDLYCGRTTDDQMAKRYIYTPVTATLDCRLWVEPGDKIIIKRPKTNVNGDYLYDSKGNVIIESTESFVLSRTITGIKALTDQIETKGVQ